MHRSVVPERVGRPYPRFWQDVICFVFGHGWGAEPWCDVCGRLGHWT